MKLKTYIFSIAMVGALGCLTVSCDDMLDKGNDYVEYGPGITTPSDSVTFVVGILNKLQAIAVRNNLFGEVRGDLVKVNSNATTDLKEIAELDVSDDNAYNVPRDYYAVINNCNYYLANVDASAGNESRNEKYFEREIAQVHSIRAWTYLQLALTYGSVPLITDPIVTAAASKASYPMKNIGEICDYFIEDLLPYNGTEYPNYTTIGGDIDPKMCFFPTQIVLGDLYLWKAAYYRDPNYARDAAKSYYDYIMWDISGKEYLTTRNTYWRWGNSDDNIDASTRFMSPTSNASSDGSTWGATDCSDITKIPMDSAAADGFYNELRNLYNTTYVTDVSQASISPSQYLIDLSEAQTYVAKDRNGDVIEITEDRLTDDAIEKYCVGDLRFQKDYSTMARNYTGSEEIQAQLINKHNSQHVSIYRAPQIYLRLAEALNYAGYPRFAKQILVMGLSNNVIEYMVSPYYVQAMDSTFISYFDFNTNNFTPLAESYTQRTTDYGVVTSTTPVTRDASECNMWGIHSRGSGYAYLDETYAPDVAIDSVSTGYPFDEEAAIPTKPSTVTEPSRREPLSYDEWALTQTSPTEAHYNTYCTLLADSVETWDAYLEDLATYEASVDVFLEKYNDWYYKVYSSADYIGQEQKQVDGLILTEQALEMSYEGNRYYDLMRRAYWWNDNSYLTGMQDKTGASRLNSRSNWFIHWDGQIGLYEDE